MNIKKGLKYFLGIVLIGLLLFIILLFFYGGFNVKGTINTRYHAIENSSDRIIETNNFSIRTLKYWVHIFGGYGNEGDPWGAFQTPNGIIHYEYGNWGPDYSEDDSVYEYIVEKKLVNRFQINIARNNKNETGICIPVQNEMKRNFTFYMDNSVTDNYEALIEGVKEIEFK